MKRLAKAEFGKRLEAALEEAGLTQRAFADELEVEPSTVSRWVSGASFPDDDRFPTICRLVGKRPEYFMGEAAPVPPTVEALLELTAKQEARIRELELRIRTVESEPRRPRWNAAETTAATEVRIPRAELELLEQISPDNKEAWEIIRTTALTIGKAKPRVKPRT